MPPSDLNIFINYKDGADVMVITLRREDDNIRVTKRPSAGLASSELLTRCGLVGYIQTLGVFLLSTEADVHTVGFSFPALMPICVTRETLADESVQEAILEAARITSDSWFADFPAGYESDSSTSN